MSSENPLRIYYSSLNLQWEKKETLYKDDSGVSNDFIYILK